MCGFRGFDILYLHVSRRDIWCIRVWLRQMGINDLYLDSSQPLKSK
jgi:hypothetical protein